MNWIDFRAPPSIGTVIMLDGQAYELELVEPHVRRDGRPTSLLTWRTLCPKCGTSFTVTTGLAAKAVNRRCSSCKRSGAPVSRVRGKAVNVVVVDEIPSTKEGF